MAKGLLALRFTPNTITVIAFLVGVVAALSIAIGWLVVAFVLIWVSGLLDVLDGTAARLAGRVTASGAFFDLILDRMVECAVIIGFAVAYPAHYLAYIFFLTALVFNFFTFVVAGAIVGTVDEKGFHHDPGLVERTETLVVFALMIVFTPYIFWILMVFTILVFVTGIVRAYRTLGVSDEWWR